MNVTRGRESVGVDEGGNQCGPKAELAMAAFRQVREPIPDPSTGLDLPPDCAEPLSVFRIDRCLRPATGRIAMQGSPLTNSFRSLIGSAGKKPIWTGTGVLGRTFEKTR